jgi:hypothetical protein
LVGFAGAVLIQIVSLIVQFLFAVDSTQARPCGIAYSVVFHRHHRRMTPSAYPTYALYSYGIVENR